MKTHHFSWTPSIDSVVRIGLLGHYQLLTAPYVLHGGDVFSIELYYDDETALREFAQAARLWADSVLGVDL